MLKGADLDRFVSVKNQLDYNNCQTTQIIVNSMLYVWKEQT